MENRIKRVVKELLGRTPAGREVTIYPDDVLVVSYPKSGNTWVRFLIGNLVNRAEEIGFANLEQSIPNIYQRDNKLRRFPRPRILKSHEYFDPRYRKVIYLVRDPRDVAVSYYHFHIKIQLIEEDYPISRYVSRYVLGDLDSFGSWKENVGSWLGAREGDDGFLVLHYEKMLEAPVRELRKIADFLSVDVVDQDLERIVRLSSADRMRKLEKEQSWDLDLMKRSRMDKSFVRAAEAGGWRHSLSRSSVAEIEQSWGTLMNRLGYSLQANEPL